MLNLKKITKQLIDKYFKKQEPEKIEVKEKTNYLEPVETTIAVKMLKKKFQKPEEQAKVILTKAGDEVNDDSFVPFIYYLEQKKATGFPKTNEIEKDLGIGRNKRLALCNNAVEIGFLYKPTPTSFDYASNKEVNHD